MSEPVTLQDKLYQSYYIFAESVLTTLNSYPELELVKLKEFIISFANNFTPYGLMSPDSYNDLGEMVFTIELHRDFLWKLSFNYYLAQGFDPQYNETFIETIAFGLDVTDSQCRIENSEDISFTPPALLDKLMDYDQIKSILSSNKWLLMLVLLLSVYHRKFENDKYTLKQAIEK